MKNKITVSGAFFILAGIIVALGSIYIQSLRTNIGPFESSIYNLAITLSIGIVTMGLLSIILGLKDWQVYFQQRLSDVIRQKDYIKSLNKQELVQLQRDTFRAYFDIDLDNNPNNFLSFFEKELQKLIGSPYREDVNYFMDIKSITGNVLDIDENVRFRAKSVAGTIQDSINWIAVPDEYVSFDSAKVKIKTAKRFSRDIHLDDNGYYTLKDDEIKVLENNLGFRASLEKYKENDFIDVIISVSYKANRERYLSWTMSQLTDRFTITINYPDNMQATYEVLGINIDNIQVNNGRSIITIKCNTWALPNTGVVLGLNQKTCLIGLPKASLPPSAHSTSHTDPQEALPQI